MTRYDDIPYEARRNPALPWGYWILIDAEGDSSRPLIDEYGRRWRSLRDALWSSRLGMIGGGCIDTVEGDQLEFLLAVLAMINRTVVSTAGVVIDMFGGSWLRTAH